MCMQQELVGHPVPTEAIELSSFEVAELLLNRGTNTDAADTKGFPALRCAAYGGRIDTMRFLLEHGADVNTSNTKGRQAISYAASNG